MAGLYGDWVESDMEKNMRTQLSQEDERRRKSGGNYTTGLSNWKHSKVKKKKKNK